MFEELNRIKHVLMCFADSGFLHLISALTKGIIILYAYSPFLYLVCKPSRTGKIFLCILDLNSNEALSYLIHCL